MSLTNKLQDCLMQWKSSFVLSFSLKHLHMQTRPPPPYSELATPIIGTQHLGQLPHLRVGKHKILACWTMPVPSLDRARTTVGISRWVTHQKPRTPRTSFRHLVVLLLLNQLLLPLYLVGRGQCTLRNKANLHSWRNGCTCLSLPA